MAQSLRKIVALFVAGCVCLLVALPTDSPLSGKLPSLAPPPPKHVAHHDNITGIVSWYNLSGSTMANGQRFNPHNPHTIANKHLPFCTVVQITNTTNNQALLAVVTDRGPYVGGRIADLTPAGAATLGFRKEGVAQATIKVVWRPMRHHRRCSTNLIRRIGEYKEM